MFPTFAWSLWETCSAEVVIKTLLLIVLTVVVLGVGSALAIMNNACKANHHTWCSPAFNMRHHVKAQYG
jgi:hypothetical protein